MILLFIYIYIYLKKEFSFKAKKKKKLFLFIFVLLFALIFTLFMPTYSIDTNIVKNLCLESSPSFSNISGCLAYSPLQIGNPMLLYTTNHIALPSQSNFYWWLVNLLPHACLAFSLSFSFTGSRPVGCPQHNHDSYSISLSADASCMPIANPVPTLLTHIYFISPNNDDYEKPIQFQTRTSKLSLLVFKTEHHIFYFLPMFFQCNIKSSQSVIRKKENTN